jgi:hypothetical protein
MNTVVACPCDARDQGAGSEGIPDWDKSAEAGQTMTTISAQFGEPAKGGEAPARGRAVPVGRLTYVCTNTRQIPGYSDCHPKGTCDFSDGLRCDTWFHAVGSPIRLSGPDRIILPLSVEIAFRFSLSLHSSLQYA